MANHGYINTTSCACWDVDSLNRCAVYATGDVDNAVFVELGAPNVTAQKTIKGYEFPVVKLADAQSKHVWVIATPEVGQTIDMQIYSDPRKFYNEAGKPMSAKYLMPITDCIEVNAEAFADGELPETTDTVVTIGANGKLVAGTSAPTGGEFYCSILGFKTIAVGMEKVPVVVLQVESN